MDDCPETRKCNGRKGDREEVIWLCRHQENKFPNRGYQEEEKRGKDSTG